MDKNLNTFFVTLGFSEEDISLLLATAPSLKITTYEHAMDNIMEVVSCGYPMEDIDGLIFANPKFLTKPTELITNGLKLIKGNVEDSLKNDPFLI